MRNLLAATPPKVEAQLRTAAAKTMRRVRFIARAVGPFVFSILGLSCFSVYLPRFHAALAQLPNPRDLQLAVGALIGTVLTLGFSLSIIPIQRASEMYTPTIIRLFRTARAIQLPFLALLSICLTSFASVLLPVAGIAATKTIPILIIFVAISLDLLRQLYRTVTALLQPKEAVWRLERTRRRPRMAFATRRQTGKLHAGELPEGFLRKQSGA
jgi:hypothetical protein